MTALLAGLVVLADWCSNDRTGHTKAIRAQYERPDGFSSCAIVGSSGLLLQQRLGATIDEYDLVMRTNLSPVGGFEEVVGSKTTVRVMNTEASETYLLERACPSLQGRADNPEGPDDPCPAYSIHLNSNKEAALREQIVGACDDTLVTGRAQIPASDRVVRHFSKRTGGHVMTGAWGIALAMHLCPNGIDAYGYTHAGVATLSVGSQYHCVAAVPEPHTAAGSQCAGMDRRVHRSTRRAVCVLHRLRLQWLARGHRLALGGRTGPHRARRAAARVPAAQGPPRRVRARAGVCVPRRAPADRPRRGQPPPRLWAPRVRTPSRTPSGLP